MLWDFFYQTTDPNTNELIGTPNTPVDIAKSQSFVLGFTPTQAFAPIDVLFSFSCTNTGEAPLFPGVNTFLLSASDTPVPDLIAIAATPDGDGIVKAFDDGTPTAFGVAVVNIGSAAAIDVSIGFVSAPLPAAFTLCQTDPVTAACVNPTVPTAPPLSTSFAAGETLTFSVFVAATDHIDFIPQGNRAFVQFLEVAAIRGSTSVAVQTVSPEIPNMLGTFDGFLSETFADCADPNDNIDLAFPLTITIDTQDGQSFSGTTFSEAPFGSAIIRQEGTITGTVLRNNTFTAELTSDVFVDDVHDSTAISTATGTIDVDRLSFSFSGMVVDGDTCTFQGFYEGDRFLIDGGPPPPPRPGY